MGNEQLLTPRHSEGPRGGTCANETSARQEPEHRVPEHRGADIRPRPFCTLQCDITEHTLLRGLGSQNPLCEIQKAHRQCSEATEGAAGTFRGQCTARLSCPNQTIYKGRRWQQHLLTPALNGDQQGFGSERTLREERYLLQCQAGRPALWLQATRAGSFAAIL